MLHEHAFEVLERSTNIPTKVMIVTERNKCGTWGVAAYFERQDGARERRLIATCETQKDAAKALRSTWSTLGAW